MFSYDDGTDLLYSQAPVRHLRDQVSGRIPRDVNAEDYVDMDFRRRYAAILLKERGL